MTNLTQDRKTSKAIEKKKKDVERISSEIAKAKSLCLIDLRNLPDRILQKTRKQLKQQAKVIIAQKAVLIRALEKAKINIRTKINFPAAIILSDTLTPYKLYQMFKKNAQKVFAKPGQIAPKDIVVFAGETDLPPGPALTELKNAKIPAMIKGGKIAIQKDTVVVKQNEVILDPVAKVLQKLNIQPFEVSLKILEGVEEKINYFPEVLDLDAQKLEQDLIYGFSIANNMAINTNYPTVSNIDILLAKSYAQAKSLAFNAGVYSVVELDMLLASALRQGQIIENKINKNI
ncbi:MAG: 50S ribosomal protein L10 [Candidatus Anstonellaceae archaeon]